MPAKPIVELRARLRRHHLDAVVHRAETDATLNECGDGFLVVALHSGMATAAIRVNDHRVRAREDFFIAHPSVRVDLDAEARQALQAFLKQERSGAELVRQRPVAGLAGDDDELARRVRSEDSNGGGEDEGGEE